MSDPMNGNLQIAALAKAVRKRADALGDAAYMAQEEISGELYRLARDAAELGRVLANIVEGKPLDRAFGAPGDWGYDHPIGQALVACYAAGRASAKATDGDGVSRLDGQTFPQAGTDAPREQGERP